MALDMRIRPERSCSLFDICRIVLRISLTRIGNHFVDLDGIKLPPQQSRITADLFIVAKHEFIQFAKSTDFSLRSAVALQQSQTGLTALKFLQSEAQSGQADVTENGRVLLLG